MHVAAMRHRTIQIVFMFLIILYAFCFRIKDLDKTDGSFKSCKDIADFEKILLEHYNIKNTLLGLYDFLLYQECLFPFKGACTVSEVTML